MEPKKSLTIVFVTNNYTPYSAGVVSSLQVTWKELSRQGHKVFIIAPDFLGSQHCDPEYVYRVPSCMRFMYNNNHMALPWCPDRAVRNIIRTIKPDIIHSHHPFLLGVSAVKAAKKLKIPILFTYHTLYHEYAHYVPLPRTLTRHIIDMQVRSYCRLVSGIIAPSDAVKKLVQDYAPSCKVSVVPTGVAQEFLGPWTGPKKRSSSHPFRLLYVGRFTREKNCTFLLNMFAQLCKKNNACILTLVGYGPEYNALRELAFTTLGIAHNRIIFVLKPSKKELIDYYAQADLFVFASQSDTQGLVMLEAMAAGTPVVALPGAGQNTLVQSGYNGYIVSGRQTMIECIIKIMSDHDLHQQLQQHARTTAHRYTPQACVEKLINVYGQMCIV